MANYTTADIKKLREETGAGMLDCKKCLDEADGNYDQAKKLALAKGLAKADKKADRETKEGYIASYVHQTNKVAAMVEILCETDFVAKNSDFQEMAKNVAMHITAMNPDNVEELLAQSFVRDPEITIEELVKRTSGKIGEKFVVNRFIRYEVGQQ